MPGYADSAYARALAEFGTPLALPRAGGWLLERETPDSADRDAMGCYPLFACADWTGLDGDLEALGERLVSVALVADPFGEYDPADLGRTFRDVCVPFKEHFVVDLRHPGPIVSNHHRRNATLASRLVQVELSPAPADHLEAWTSLYATLIERHGITGVSAFSRASFERQLAVPGIVAFRAVREGATVGMLLWYVDRNVAYYHLGAYSDAGYELRASFALFSAAIEHFSGQVRWLNLGAGAGATGDGSDGLTRFKRGWATGTRTAYFCGRILAPRRYASLAAMRPAPPTSYFPVYRYGEFA
jgi:GNAT acetyltransferase-like protein